MTQWDLALLVVASLKLAFFFAVAVSPCVWLIWQLAVNQSVLTRLSVGFAVGFAWLVVVAWYAGLWSLDLVPFVWCASWLAVIWFGLRSKSHSSPAAKSSSSFVWPAVATTLSLSLGVAFQLYALSLSELPHGVDVTFHCVVALRQLDAGQATTNLWPLEELRLNYPIGSHLWVALASKWTGLSVHDALRHTFVLAIVWSGLTVAAWSERLFGSPWHAAAAAFIFVFGSYQASFLPYMWGGIPSMLAIWLWLAGAYCVWNLERAGVWFGMLLFGATALIHHHSMVVLLGGTGAAALIGYMWRGARASYRRVLVSLMGAGVVCAIYAVPLLTRVGELDDTGSLAYSEGDFAWPWRHVWSWGPSLFVCSTVGFLVRGAVDSRDSRRFLVVMLIGLFAGFALLDYGGRWVGPRFYGQPATPFTPSRFIFYAQSLLAIFASAGLVAILSPLRFTSVRGAVVLAIAAFAIWTMSQQWRPNVADRLLPVGHWVDKNLPADSLVIGSPSPWTTYVCRRESASLFIPISETLTPRHAVKKRLAAAPNSETTAEWTGRLGKPIYAISVKWDRTWGSDPLYVSGNLAVFEMNLSNR